MGAKRGRGCSDGDGLFISLNRDFFAQKNSISVLTQRGNRCVFPEIKPLPSPHRDQHPVRVGLGWCFGGPSIVTSVSVTG